MTREELARAAGLLHPPASWLAALERAREAPEFERLRRQLEQHWLARARRPSQRLLRSPPYRQRRLLSAGGEAFYTYERSLWPRPLEEIEVALAPGWEAQVVAVRSRRAALWTFLVTVRDLLRQDLAARCWSLEEDDLRLLELLAGPRWSWSAAWRLDTLLQGLEQGRGGLYLLGTGGLNLEHLAQAWNRRPPEDGAVWLLDASEQPELELDALLGKLIRPPTLVARLVELRPWHTLGLDLGRAAWLTFYGPAGAGLTECRTAAELARRVRSVLGTGLSLAELGALTGPFQGYRPQAGGGVGTPGEVAAPARRQALGNPTLATRRAWLARADLREGNLEALEARLVPPELPSGWAAQGLLFRSGMAAISAVLAMLEKLGVSMQASYFETRFLHHVSGLPPADVLFAESVAYDWELQPFEVPERLPPVVVLDTTLTGERFPMELVLREGLVIRLFSALKLHQAGLELENAGAVVVYSNQGQAGAVGDWLREARRLTDTGLTPREVARLAADFFLTDRLHAERVFANNAWLAAHLHPQPGLVARVVHPSRHSRLPWAVAPFCVLHLAAQAIDNHRLLAGILEHEARRRRLPLVRGASFGFEGHRHEFIIPVLKENRALFKVAMGSGPGREGVLELLQEVLGWPDFAALRAAWPRVPLAEPPRDWSTPSEELLDYIAGEEA